LYEEKPLFRNGLRRSAPDSTSLHKLHGTKTGTKRHKKMQQVLGLIRQGTVANRHDSARDTLPSP